MRLISTSALILIAVLAYSQEIAENYTDEFLNVKVVRTDWTPINKPSEHLAFFRVSAVDSIYFLEYKKVVDKAYSVDRQKLMVKFNGSDEMLQAESTNQSKSCLGCGAKGFAGSSAWGVHMVYALEKPDVSRLRHEQVSKIRIYTGQGYIEEDFTDEKQVKKALAFQKAVMLVMAAMQK